MLRGGLAVPIPLSRGEVRSIECGEMLPDEISSMLCNRSCEDDDDLLSSSTVPCGDWSNVTSPCNEPLSICRSTKHLQIKH